MPSVQIKDVPHDVHAVRARALAARQSLQEYLLALDRRGQSADAGRGSRPRRFAQRRSTLVRGVGSFRAGGPWSSLTRACSRPCSSTTARTETPLATGCAANASPHRRSSTSKCSRRSGAKPRPVASTSAGPCWRAKTWRRCRCSEHHINVCWNVVGRCERTSRSTTPRTLRWPRHSKSRCSRVTLRCLAAGNPLRSGGRCCKLRFGYAAPPCRGR